MKNLFKKTNIRIILMLVAILLAIDILVRVMFNFHLTFDATNFNNILTPIATIISMGLFVWISLRQDKWVRRQNNKTHIERSFITALERLKEDFTHYPLPRNSGYCNGLNFWAEIIKHLGKVTSSVEYLNDLSDHQKGIIRPWYYFKYREYYDSLLFLTQFKEATKFYDPVEALINEIISLDLDEVDKNFFIKRIINEMIESYYSFYANLNQKDFEDSKLVPLINHKADSVEFKDFYKTEFGSYFEFFKQTIFLDK